MQNILIKKVLLFIVLFFFAVKGVFALHEAISFNVIHGNKPVLKSFNNSQPHKISVTIYKEDQKTEIGPNDQIEEGNVVYIKYKLEDEDGDEDHPNIQHSFIADSIKIFTKNLVMNDEGEVVEQWKELTEDDTMVHIRDKRDGVGTLLFRINRELGGATKIGFKILERTRFGVPYVNNWIIVTDITASTDPYVKSAITTTEGIEKVDIIGPTLSEVVNKVKQEGHDFGPGESARGRYPVANFYSKASIFKYDSKGVLDLSRKGNMVADYGGMAYGNKFAAVVWIDSNSNQAVDKGELIITDYYKFNWTLSGTSEGVTASPTPLTVNQGVSGSDNQYIFLGSSSGKGHNYIYATEENGYKAGAQDFYLHLEPILK